jgi:Na+-driven multidrug efflux pump
MAQKSILACMLVACCMMGLVSVLFMTEGKFLTSIISHEPVHLKHVPNLLFIAGTVQVIFAIAMVMRLGLRGAGDAMWPFIITSVSSYFIRLPLAWLLGVHFGLGIEGIWIGLCAELVIRAAMFSARFLNGGWKQLQV